MTKKIDIATELFKANAEKPRAEVIEMIMKKLSVTKGNASIYYAKAKDRSAAPAKPAAADKKAETTAKLKESVKSDTPKEKVDAKGGKTANTAAREAINDALKGADDKGAPETLKK